ncbi:hypothetical protein D0T49_04480 [Paludibacter sp. 221]|nr:hypothetical protein [Paludibacter sp. 221]
MGNKRKIGFGGAFFLSLLLSPIIGLIIVLFSKTKEEIDREIRILKTQREQKEHLERLVNQKSVSDITNELTNLKKLLDDGVLDKDEFDKMKRQIIDPNPISEYDEWWNRD